MLLLQLVLVKITDFLMTNVAAIIGLVFNSIVFFSNSSNFHHV